MPEVSVIMPARNAASCIDAAVRSVLAQSFQDWELIIVDDASSDDTRLRAEAHQQADSRIRCHASARRIGVASARNRALDDARGRYIAFLDSDDTWTRDKLSLQLQQMSTGTTAITYGDYVRVGMDGRPLTYVSAPPEITYAMLLRSNHIGMLTALYDRQSLPHLRFADVGHQDYLFWLHALQQLQEPIRATAPGRPLGHYRVGAGALSSNKLRSARWQWRIYRRHLGLGRARSLLLMAFYIYHVLRKRCGGRKRARLSTLSGPTQ